MDRHSSCRLTDMGPEIDYEFHMDGKLHSVVLLRDYLPKLLDDFTSKEKSDKINELASMYRALGVNFVYRIVQPKADHDWHEVLKSAIGYHITKSKLKDKFKALNTRDINLGYYYIDRGYYGHNVIQDPFLLQKFWKGRLLLAQMLKADMLRNFKKRKLDHDRTKQVLLDEINKQTPGVITDTIIC